MTIISETKNALASLAGSTLFYGSISDLVRKIRPGIWDKTQDFEQLRACVESVENSLLDLTASYSPEEGILLLLDGENEQLTGDYMFRLRWVLCCSSGYRWYDAIKAIAEAVTTSGQVRRGTRKSYAVKNPKLFEVFFMLYMEHRGAKSLRQAILARRKRLLSNASWFPNYSSAPWKAHRASIVENLRHSEAAEVALDPAVAYQRLVEREAGLGYCFVPAFLRSSDFTALIEASQEFPLREDVLDQIAGFTRFPGDKRVFSITGGIGCGKSTLMRAMLKREYRRGVNHPCFFVRNTHGTRIRAAKVLTVLAVKITPALLNEPGFTMLQSDEEAVDLLTEALKPFMGSHRLTLFIDGLDETEPPMAGHRCLSELLSEVRFPAGAKLVLASRPTVSFIGLLDHFGVRPDVVLDHSTNQQEAIAQYYRRRIAADSLSTSDFETLLRVTAGSFLYAEYMVRDIPKAIHEQGSYDLKNAPASFDERWELEWRRFLQGPLNRDRTVRLLAAIAAHRGTPALAELAEFSALEFADIEAFFAPHMGQFQGEITSRDCLSPDTRISGFRHPDLYRFLIEKKLLPLGMRRAHRRIVSAYRDRAPGKELYELKDDGYLFDNLAFHISQGGHINSLEKLLLSFRWIKKRLDLFDVLSLLDDFSYGKNSPSLKTVSQALNVSAAVLLKDKMQLPSQLYARLLSCNDPRIKKLRRSMLLEVREPWLRALTPTLLSAQAGLVQVATPPPGSSGWLAYSRDGSRAVARVSDGSLVVWNIMENAECFRTDGEKVRLCDIAGASDHYFLGTVRSFAGFDEVEIQNLQTRDTWLCPKRFHERVDRLIIVDNGQVTLILFGDDSAQVWEMGSTTPLYCQKRFSGAPGKCILCPDGRTVVLSEFNYFCSMDLGIAKRTFFSIPDGMWCFAESPVISGDGKRVACSLSASAVEVFDLKSGELLRTVSYTKNCDPISIALTHDGRRVGLAFYDGTIFIFDVGTGKCCNVLPRHPEKPVFLAFTDSGRNVISYDESGVARVWDMNKLSAEWPKTAHQMNVVSLAVDEGTGQVYSSGADCVVKTWALPSGTELDSSDFCGYSSLSVCMRAEQAVFMGARPNRSIAIWSPTCADIGSLVGDIGLWQPRALAGDPSLRRLVLSRGDDIECWDLETLVRRFCAPVGDARVTALAVSSDATRAVVALDSNRLMEWNLDTNTIIRTIQLGSHVPVKALRFSADDKHVISCTSAEVSEWDLVEGIRLRSIPVPTPLTCDAAVTPDGTYVVENCHTYFDVTNTDSGQALLRGDNYGYIKAAIISADGAKALSIGDCGDLILWSVPDNKQIAEIFSFGTSAAMMIPQNHRVVFDRIEFFLDVCEMKDDGIVKTLGPFRRPPTFLASGPGGEICILDDWPEGPLILDGMKGWSPLKFPIGSENNHAFCIVAGSHKVAAGLGSAICIWDRDSRRQIQYLENERRRATTLAFTDNDAQLLTGYVDGEVALWDIRSGRKLWSRAHHTKDVTALAIAPTKGLFLSGGRDYAIKVAELATGVERVAFCLDEGATCAALTQDASIAVVGTSSGAVHFLKIENL